MPAADAGTDAGVDSPLPVRNSFTGSSTGRVYRSITEVILIVAGIFTDTTEQSLPVVEPCSPGYVYGNSCWRCHVGPAKNDNESECRSSAGSPGTDDALDDAADVRIPLYVPSQRSGGVLGNLDGNPDNNAVFQHGMGRAYFAVPRRWYWR
jgi:hypothetical protein